MSDFFICNGPYFVFLGFVGRVGLSWQFWCFRGQGSERNYSCISGGGSGVGGLFGETLF